MGKRKQKTRGSPSVKKQRGNGSSGSSLVVVNPAFAQSAATTSTKASKQPKQSKTASKKSKIPQNASKNTISYSVFAVDHASQQLTAAYHLVQNATKKTIIVLPKDCPHTPTKVGNTLKTLGLPSLSLHHKLSSNQKKEVIQRAHTEANAILTLPDHFLSKAVIAGSKDCILFSDNPDQVIQRAEKVFEAFSSITVVCHTATSKALVDAKASDMQWTPALRQQLQKRVTVAGQIVDLSASSRDAVSSYAKKMAKQADLSDDEDSKPAKQTPEQQKLQSLSQKLTLLLSQSAQTSHNKADKEHLKDKLELLHMTSLNATVGTSITAQRLSATTCWLDNASGATFDGDWDGSIRHGASKDATSLSLQSAYKQSREKWMKQWQPNPYPDDMDAWGGSYGKVCGHNEVVMHHLRPFFPMHVLNSRVCSRMHPAPGNRGFDGCLEHLRLACIDAKQSMTVWDDHHFMYIQSNGDIIGVKKDQLLVLPVGCLRWLLEALRQWTVKSQGRHSVNTYLEAIQECCARGMRPSSSSRIMKRIMLFAVGGSNRVWKQFQQLKLPVEETKLFN